MGCSFSAPSGYPVSWTNTLYDFLRIIHFHVKSIPFYYCREICLIVAIFLQALQSALCVKYLIAPLLSGLLNFECSNCTNLAWFSIKSYFFGFVKALFRFIDRVLHISHVLISAYPHFFTSFLGVLLVKRVLNFLGTDILSVELMYWRIELIEISRLQPRTVLMRSVSHIVLLKPLQKWHK